MSTNAPHARLVDTWTWYIADATEAEDDIDTTPSGNWAAFGETVDDQVIKNMGALTYLTNNSTTSHTKAIRPETNLEIVLQLAHITQEQLAAVLHDDGNMVTETSGTPSTKKVGFARDFEPVQYSIMGKGLLMSPYGALPAQLYVPIVVVDGEPELVFSKAGSPSLEVVFHAIYDSSQSTGLELGWWRAQVPA